MSLNRVGGKAWRRCQFGVVGSHVVVRQRCRRVTKCVASGTVLERRTVGGKSPVHESDAPLC